MTFENVGFNPFHLFLFGLQLLNLYLPVNIPYNKKILEVINTQEITQENIQDKILEIIKQEPTVTRNILAVRLKTTPDRIKYYLSKMRKQGVIKHEGSTKSGHWIITK